MPERVQLSRTRGWRKPPGMIVVSRPSRWGNPIKALDVGSQYPSLDDRQVATLIVRDFKVLAERGHLGFPNWRHFGGERGPVAWTYPPVAEIREQLGGRDLGCWCPLAMPCHADVLLRIANPDQDGDTDA